MKVEKIIHWVAECKYDGYENFSFFSPEFIWDWKDGDMLEQAQVISQKEWEKISPYPCPKVVAIHPGVLYHIPTL